MIPTGENIRSLRKTSSSTNLTNTNPTWTELGVSSVGSKQTVISIRINKYCQMKICNTFLAKITMIRHNVF